MEAVIGLAGVVVGWFLALLVDRAKQRTEAKNAAAIIYAELLNNRQVLRDFADGFDPLAMDGTRRIAWDTYGVTLLRIADEETLAALIESYHHGDTVSRHMRYLRDESEAEQALVANLQERLEDPNLDVKLRPRLAQELKRRSEKLKIIQKSTNDYRIHMQKSELPAVVGATERVQKLTRFP